MSADYPNHSLGRATLVIGVFSLLAKLSGLARDAIFSHEFGTSAILDAYFAAFRIPDFVYNILIAGTVTVAFIPIFSEYLLKDKTAAFRFAVSVFNVTLLGLIITSLLALGFINPLMDIVAAGFSDETLTLAKTMARILLLSPILLGLASIVGSVLNNFKRFALISAVPVVYNLSIIVGAVVFYPAMGPSGLAWGVVLGCLLYLVIPLTSVWRLGWRHSLTFDLTDPGVGKFWRLYWPRIFSMGTGQVTLLIATYFGSFLAEGSLSAFYYANNLQAVFLSVFAVSAAIAVFPTLADLFNQGAEQRFKDVLAKTTVQILYFLIPLSVLMLVLRAQIVRLVLGMGESTSFSFADTRLVALTLGLFAVSLFAQGLTPLFLRAFYARHSTYAPVVISIITVLLNIASTYYFVERFGVPGMAIAFSLSTILQLLMLVVELHRRMGNIHDQYLMLNTIKIVSSAAAAGLLTYWSLYLVAPLVDMRTYWGVLIQGGSAGLAGALTFLGVSYLLGLAETRHLLSLLRSFADKVTRYVNI